MAERPAPEAPRSAPPRPEPPVYAEPPAQEWDNDPRDAEPNWDELPPAAAQREERELHRVAEPTSADPNGLRAVPPPGDPASRGHAPDAPGHAPANGAGSLAAVPPPTPERAAEPEPGPAQPPAAAEAPGAQAPPAQAPVGMGIDDLVAVWGAVIENLRGRDMLCASAIAQSRPVELDGTEIVIVFPMDAAFYRGTADREERRIALREALREVTGITFSFRFELRDLAGAAPIEVPPPAPAAPRPAAPAPADHAPPESAPQPEVARPQPVAAATPATYTPSSASLDENAVVAHLVTEFDAEELTDDPGPEDGR